MHRSRRRRGLIVAALAGLLLANGAGCSSCAKDDVQPAGTGPSPVLSVNPKIKIVDKRMHPRIGEEGGFLVPLDSGSD
jgi:hypothetical protein